MIIIGHGSRTEGADDDMERVALALRRKRGGIVEVCRLEGKGPSFPVALERCLGQGAKRIVVIPYFLHLGVHLRRDIPRLLSLASEDHPEIGLVLGRHLGCDEALVDLISRRIDEAEGIGYGAGPPKEGGPAD